MVAGVLLLSACAASPEAESGGSVERQTLSVGSLDEPFDLNPATGRSGKEYSYLKAIYATLIDYDPATLQPSPGLAESFEFRGEGDLEFAIKLREGLTFQDGTPVDAEAVKTSLEYFQDAGVRADLDPVTAITVEGTHDLVLTLGEPYAPLPAMLADRAGMIISPTAIEKHGEALADNPVGAGAYGLESWTKGVSMELSAHDGFWAGAPEYAGLDIAMYEDEGALISALVAGQVEFAYPLTAEQIPVIDASEQFEVEAGDSIAFKFLRVNQTREPLNDKRVRQALNLALDRQAMGTAMLGDLNVVPATVPVPPGYYAYGSGTYEYPYDVDRARELLAEAGYPDGVTIDVCPSTSRPETIKQVQIYQDQVAKAGITLDVTQVPGDGCIDQFYDGQWSLMLSGHTGRVDPWFTYAEAWTAAGGNNMNNGEPINEEMERLLEEVRVTTDLDEQSELYTRINEIFLDEAPMVGLYYNPTITARVTGIEGVGVDLQGKVLLSNLRP